MRTLAVLMALSTVIYADQRTVEDCIKDCEAEYREALEECSKAGKDGSGFEQWENEHDCDTAEIQKDREECQKDCECMHNDD